MLDRKILSMIPAEPGWFVITRVGDPRGKCEFLASRVIAWAHTYEKEGSREYWHITAVICEQFEDVGPRLHGTYMTDNEEDIYHFWSKESDTEKVLEEFHANFREDGEKKQ